VVRDLNPDPGQPYHSRSIIRAAALTIDTENQMKEWNRGVFANSARPSLIFSTNEPLDDEAFKRWEAQFRDQHAGAENAYKPLLIEGGDAKPYMLSQQDLDFLASRKFSGQALHQASQHQAVLDRRG
jgi:phage portal protein BeeE